jgi:hypothetical protein
VRCSEQTRYQVTNQPIVSGQYIIGIYNYKGRRIEADCDISVTVSACYTDSGDCESSRHPQTTTGWLLGLFMLAGLPLFCFIPFFYCIRRIRLATRDQWRPGHVDQMGRAGGNGQPQGHRRPRPRPGLTTEEIASVHSFVCEPRDGEQSMRHPSLSSDACSVCLMEFEAGELYVQQSVAQHSSH